MSDLQSQDLCTRCGLCCDGTFFSEVPIQADESIKDYQEVGLVIKPHPEHGLSMPQPCSEFIEGKCRCYRCRPVNCRRFRCSLLRRQDRGEVEEARALEIVEIAKAKLVSLQRLAGDHFPEIKNPSFRIIRLNLDQKIQGLSEKERHDFYVRHNELFLECAALKFYLKQHFYVEKKANSGDGEQV